jgi:hypothetical protein
MSDVYKKCAVGTSPLFMQIWKREPFLDALPETTTFLPPTR